MAKLFGTNGIRGIFGQDLNLEFIHDISLSIATYFKKGPILIGYDGRDSSPVIAKVVSAAINSSGLDCKIAGLVPTPCLEYAIKSLGYSGGIMITASHNPPKYNGIKPVASDGVEISREDELIIEEIYFNKKWISSESWGNTGTETRAKRAYYDGIMSHIDADSIISKKFKVALDLGNGAQAVTAPELCKELGCMVFSVHETIDGNFPGRGSEPTPQNLEALSRCVKENSCDFGVAFDGDGDRSLICDELGNVLTGDKSALLLSKFLLGKFPSSKIVTCLNSGSAIEEIAKQADSQVIRTRVGSVEVSRKMVPINALIGFEENGGFMFGKHNQVRDGAMTMCLVLDLLSKSGQKLSALTKELPPSFTTKDKVSCTKEQSVRLIKTLKEENPSADTTEGIKINVDSKNWIMVRPSGTEPIVRIYAEASSQEKLDELMSKYMKIVTLALSE
ncbi:phosphoglucosamine mutase [Nitrosopumilus sp. b1]|uniref:phosphoglucosamine mutase n=1 Tax=Nitrosopumilus sp. b1 TaxID=2109907 RepID=UPI0015F3D7D3|nr:phosphoglucosamine mutase [Nitrosopumilus sp. b1]KAF6243505.1 phosphoglucosamine mutase [Nitrosopumilus sp. b1]